MSCIIKKGVALEANLHWEKTNQLKLVLSLNKEDSPRVSDYTILNNIFNSDRNTNRNLGFTFGIIELQDK